MSATEIRGPTVIRALYDLHSRHGDWPTTQQVCDYLKATYDEVHPVLKQLERDRLFQGRRRRGEIRWFSWGAA